MVFLEWSELKLFGKLKYQKRDKSWRVYRENSFEQIWFGQRKSTSGCVLKWEQMNVAQSKC